jgi:CubicO group peptidase (beta-lactamase class C family)
MKKLRFIITVVSLFCIFGTAKPDSLHNSKESKDSLEIKIDTMIARMGLSSETPGGVVGIIKDGKLIFKKSYGLANFEKKEPNTTSTLFNLASVSKQFTAAAILVLANENKLSLTDDIRKYLPDFPDYGYTITIENLIHHTCGIRSNDVLELMAGNLNSNKTMEEVYSLIIKQKSLNFKPGEEFLYSNSGYVLLAMIIEKTSGMKFSKFVEERIFRPTGMVQTLIYDNPDKRMINCASGHTWGGEEKFKRSASLNTAVVGESNVYTCLEDFLQWDNNFYKNRLEKWDFGKEMTSLTTFNNGDTCNYAFGLRISERNGLRTISHQGGTGDFTAQYIQIPSEKFAVVCLFNIPVDVTGLSNKITDLYLKGIPKSANSSSKPEKTKVDSSVLKLYAGKYFDEKAGIGATITTDSDHLIFNTLYNGKFEIYPSSDSIFFVTFADLKVIFSKNVKGEVLKTTIIQDKQKINLTYLGTNVVPLKAEQLSQYSGDYFCEEINVTYPVLFKDSKLYIKFPESTAKFCKTKVESELISEHADNFASPVSGIQFTRDTNNEISGFIIKDLGRVRNLAFVLLKSPLTARNLSDNSNINKFLMQGEYGKVIDTCKHILTYDSLNSEIYYKMGIAYQNLLEEELSLNCYYQAASLNPENKAYNFMLAKGYYG